ncbi:hypothetical protein BV898_18227 [Hypsibius exemplaris]|uniref:Uncharacterized protein n=1 Tax=Hypsibius exemplaris TaxID=2072580 RepID=A0A9X6NGG0_HYPEX|nr:hypothetical protein BV898_18227 [Hypsibius exemplaris]
MAAVLALLKLQLDFSEVRSVSDVLDGLEMPLTVTHKVCRTCNEDLDLGLCSPECEETLDESYVSASLRTQLQHVLEESPSPRLRIVFLLDEMHFALLGVTKRFFTVWSEHTTAPYHLSKEQVAEFERRLLSFQPPAEFTRLPRKLKVAQYKSNEFRALINHYSVYCLDGLLPRSTSTTGDCSSQHIRRRVSGSIHPTELLGVGKLLAKFVDETVTLYGKNMCGINVHSLVHMHEMVQMWGPLWAYSLFPFEKKNGWITRHCHAKTSILRSVMMALTGSQVLRQAERLITVKAERRLLNKLRGKRCTKGISGENWITRSVPRLGAVHPLLAASLGPCVTTHNLRFVTHAEVDRITVWTSNYTRATRKCSRYFSMTDNATGEHGFVEVLHLAICQQCRRMWAQCRALDGTYYGVSTQYTVTLSDSVNETGVETNCSSETSKTTKHSASCTSRNHHRYLRLSTKRPFHRTTRLLAPLHQRPLYRALLINLVPPNSVGDLAPTASVPTVSSEVTFALPGSGVAPHHASPNGNPSSSQPAQQLYFPCSSL